VRVSVVVETWNIDGAREHIASQLVTLAPQLASQSAELVVTVAGLDARARDELARLVTTPITWVELSRNAGYYEHKNRGFDATTGDVVAFIDGDCEPSAGWLDGLTAPFSQGARVVAGATSYPGALAALGSELDFPYYDGSDHMKRFAATSSRTAPTVRNFFANNVAFARDVFAARRYPAIAPMFHGQCQVLALHLVEDGIPIRYAAGAKVTHAWPGDLAEWLEVRLLRGADTTQLLPYVLAHYAPRIAETADRLGPLPALAVLGLRGVTGTFAALRKGPRLRGLALVASVTALDSLGALAAPAVHRLLGT
jgi:glycosyltransferase involved in cell wall biosynthesis